jgi:hypothetical protein
VTGNPAGEEVSASLGRREESRSLPLGGWTRLERVESGWWAAAAAEAVATPAALGFDGGVWYATRQGVRGLLVPDQRSDPLPAVAVPYSSRVAPSTNGTRPMGRGAVLVMM